MKSHFFTGWTALSTALLFIVCVTAQPTIAEESSAGMSFDGLIQIENSKSTKAWTKPNLDLSGYSKILPIRAEIQYRSVKKVSASAAQRSSTTEFPLDEKQKQQIEKALTDVFQIEIAKSKNFTVTDKAAPDTLIVIGTLLDVVSNVPPAPMGRSDIYLSQIGEATFAVEIRDSQSGEVLARAVDRKAPGSVVAMQSNPVTNVSQFKTTVRQWATRLISRLDSFHDM
jgi:hypothetical protein